MIKLELSELKVFFVMWKKLFLPPCRYALQQQLKRSKPTALCLALTNTRTAHVSEGFRTFVVLDETRILKKPLLQNRGVNLQYVDYISLKQRQRYVP